MTPRLPNIFRGEVIYVTPGSGKTFCTKKYEGVIDADDLLVSAIEEISPGFRDKRANDPRLVLFKYMRYINFNLRKMNSLYDRATELIDENASNGNTILLGSYRLMHLATYIFVQQNENIVRSGFRRSKETSAIDENEVAAIRYFDRYLEPALVNFPT